MYVGALSDFFYKPKDFLINLPKFKHKQNEEVTHLNIKNRIFRVNNKTGSILLIGNSKEHPLTIFENAIMDNKSRNDNLDNKYLTMNSTSRTKESKNLDHANKTINNTSFKNNEMKNLFKNDITIKKTKNKNKFKIKKIPILNIINLQKTPYPQKIPKIKSIKSVEETFKKQIIFPYYNKTPKKIKKPNIVFGQKINNEFIPNKKRINNDINFKKEKNSFLTIYRHHFININNEGNNDKIYYETKNDNLLMKTFKEQILKEKVEKDLKKKFRFFIGDNDESNRIKIPILSHNNFEFYNGYSNSDSKRGSNYNKLFFRYIRKHKMKEILEKKDNN